MGRGGGGVGEDDTSLGGGEVSSLPQSHHKWRKKIKNIKTEESSSFVQHTETKSFLQPHIKLSTVHHADLSGRGVLSLESLNS